MKIKQFYMRFSLLLRFIKKKFFLFISLCIRPKYHPSCALHKVFLNTIYVFMYVFIHVRGQFNAKECKIITFLYKFVVKKKNKTKRNFRWIFFFLFFFLRELE